MSSRRWSIGRLTAMVGCSRFGTESAARMPLCGHSASTRHPTWKLERRLPRCSLGTYSASFDRIWQHALDARQSHATMRDNPGDESVKINMNSMTAGPRHRDRLPGPLVERVRLIRAMLFEGYPHSMAYWLEGFLRDLNPEYEIAHWEQIAALNGEAMLAIPAVLPELAPDVNAHDVFEMLLGLVDFQETVLPHLQENYPDALVSLIRHMISSPTLIDLLDPD